VDKLSTSVETAITTPSQEDQEGKNKLSRVFPSWLAETKTDRRAFWGTGPKKEVRSSGERKARARFVRVLKAQPGIKLDLAVREAIGVDDPPPDGVSQELWDEFWTRQRLLNCAHVWLSDPAVLKRLGHGKAAGQAITAATHPAVMQRMIELALDPDTQERTASFLLSKLSSLGTALPEPTPDQDSDDVLRAQARAKVEASLAAKGRTVTRRVIQEEEVREVDVVASSTAERVEEPVVAVVEPKKKEEGGVVEEVSSLPETGSGGTGVEIKSEPKKHEVTKVTQPSSLADDLFKRIALGRQKSTS
jgi:hypothetical protein